MSKLRLLGVALCAVFAFGTVMATAAMAEPEWLVGGVAANKVKAETEGEVELINYEKAGSNTVLSKLLCSGIFDGTIGPGVSDEITEVLTLTMTSVNRLPLEASGLLCSVTFDNENLEDCKTGENEATIWAENLPWTTTLLLVEEGGKAVVLDDFAGTGGQPAWDAECTALIGIKGSNLCEALPGTVTTLMQNEPLETPPAVLSFFKPLALASERGTCTLTGVETTEVVSENGGLLSGNTWGIGLDLEHLATEISNQ